VIYWRTPLTDFCRFAADCFGTRPIYRLPRLITGRIRPIFSRRRRFGSAPDPPSRPANLLAPSADYRPIFALLLPIRFGARTEFTLGRFTGYLDRSTTDFCSATGDSLSPGPPSAPLLSGPNGERRIHYSTELGRPNTIYMSNAPSGPIFMFFIQFLFYPIKRSRFEKNSPPMFLKFHLVFYIFSRLFIFFLKFLNLNFKNQWFLKSHRISTIFRKIGRFF
jgi:hypothetical protein